MLVPDVVVPHAGLPRVEAVQGFYLVKYTRYWYLSCSSVVDLRLCWSWRLTLCSSQLSILVVHDVHDQVELVPLRVREVSLGVVERPVFPWSPEFFFVPPRKNKTKASIGCNDLLLKDTALWNHKHRDNTNSNNINGDKVTEECTRTTGNFK